MPLPACPLLQALVGRQPYTKAHSFCLVFFTGIIKSSFGIVHCIQKPHCTKKLMPCMAKKAATNNLHLLLIIGDFGVLSSVNT